MQRPSMASVLAWSIASMLLSLWTTGCSDETDSPSPSSEASATSESFNDADVAFVVDAGSHLTAALIASQTVAQRTDDPEIQRFAETVARAAGRRADRVATWIQEWGKAGADLGHDSEESADESGQVFGQGTMTDLLSLSGGALERRYFEALKHHVVAGEGLYRSEVSNGENQEARQFARAVLTESSEWLQEISELRARNR